MKSKPSLLFNALQILQSQPATSCSPTEPVADEKKGHVSRDRWLPPRSKLRLIDGNASPAESTTDWLWKPG